jgi:hypothetical protein
MFDPQMGRTGTRAITRTVPPPHRAVVQTQRSEFGQFTARKHFKRIFVNLSGQHDAEACNLFAEDFDDRVLDPTLAETYTRRMASRLTRARSFIRRVLKQGHTGFVPQAMADEQRRVYGNRQQGRSDRLCQIVLAGELFRPDL